MIVAPVGQPLSSVETFDVSSQDVFLKSHQLRTVAAMPLSVTLGVSRSI
jgi:hypothetical protein